MRATVTTIGMGRTVAVGVAVALAAGCQHGQRSAAGPGSDQEVRIPYGTQERGEVTGALASMTAEEIQQRTAATLEELIRGRFPGVQVVQGSNGISFRIRGTDTLLGNTEPLVVLDGMPVRQGGVGLVLSALNPWEIEEVNVLRDVASTSIYGIRGANGVILITTKH